MRFTAALSALAIALTGINADLVAFTGSDCSGDEGDNVSCDGACWEDGIRQSFEVHIHNPFINIFSIS